MKFERAIHSIPMRKTLPAQAKSMKSTSMAVLMPFWTIDNSGEGNDGSVKVTKEPEQQNSWI